MGFGTLFVAFVLLISQFKTYTDLLAALLAAMALVRLAPLERHMRYALYTSFVFIGVGAVELVGELLATVLGEIPYLWIVFPVRALTVGSLTVLVLLGIRSLAKEVGLTKLATLCECTVVTPVILYALQLLLEIPPLFASVSAEHMAIFAGVVSIFSIIMHIVNAVTVWRAYAGICMPEDVHMPEHPSRFAFVNRMREASARREEERKAEAIAAYRARMAKKKSKRSKK